MPFCPNCGKETTPGAVYCANCGRPLQGTPQPAYYVQQPYYQKKEPWLAVLLSLIIAGVGQIYAGRVLRGIVIFLAPTIFIIFIFLPALFFGTFITTVGPALPRNPPTSSFSLFPFFGFLFLLIIGAVGYHIWNIFDAYNLANVYNHRLLTTGKPPW